MLRRIHEQGAVAGRGRITTAVRGRDRTRASRPAVTELWHREVPDVSAAGEPQFPALLEVAGEIAAGVRALVPSCSCEVAVQVGATWQVVGHGGSEKVVGKRHAAVGEALGQSDSRTDHCLVATFSCRLAAARLVLLANEEEPIPPWAEEAVQAVLQQGGAVLDRALAAQQRDRAIRRLAVVRRSNENPTAAPTVDGLLEAIASLWPRTSVSYHGRDGRTTESSTIRRLVRTACDLNRAAIDEPQAARGLLGLEASRRVAIPADRRRGAFLVEMPIAGEELDVESVAAAEILVQVAGLLERQVVLTSEMRSLRHEDQETGCYAGDVLETKVEHTLADESHGDAAVLVCQVDLRNAPTDMDLAVRAGRSLLEVATSAEAEIFRVRPWRFVVVAPGASARDARLLAQRLCLAVRQLTQDRSCTASVGISLASLHGTTPMELLDAAEQAMNAAAESGGDTANVANKRGRRYASSIDVHRRLDALRTLKCLTDQVVHGGVAHSEAVAQRAVRLAMAMGLDRRTVLSVQLAGELHEIGALLVRQDKPSTSTPGDRRLNALAVSLAGRAVSACGLEGAGEIIANMHERVDGTGVPHGTSGDAIPIGSRILAVANAFETILDGLGRGDAGVDAAMSHLRLQAGRSFDARVVQFALAHAAPREKPEAAQTVQLATRDASARTPATLTRLQAA